MKWADYYERFYEWSDSTQISRISALTDFGSSAEVVEIAECFSEDKHAIRLVKKAIEHGVRFSPAEIISLTVCVDDETFSTLIKNRKSKFSESEFKELESLCYDDSLLAIIAKEDSIMCDSLDFDSDLVDTRAPQVHKPGFFTTLLSVFGSDRGSDKHAGQCTGDCSSCPAHYGYRYGRWYYGHHHTHGCELGGNDTSGKL